MKEMISLEMLGKQGGEEGQTMIYTVTFIAQFDAILANRILLSRGLDAKLMPVPRLISASCGTCVQVTDREGGGPPDLSEVSYEALYRKTETGWEKL